MSYGEQQKEIETIRERKITVKLSAADCDRLAIKCGEHGLTIGEMIENFVGDLVGGTYSNESDERDYSDRWFERCWFGMFPEQTLLSHLFCNGYEPENYLDLLDCIKYAEYDKERAKEVLEEYDEEELSFIDGDIAEWEEKLHDMRENWGAETEPNMGEEIERIKKWVEEKEELLLKNENRRPQTIEQFHIKQWIDDTFVKGCLRVEYTGKDTAKIMDNKGDIICVEYKDGEVRECQE